MTGSGSSLFSMSHKKDARLEYVLILQVLDEACTFYFIMIS